MTKRPLRVTLAWRGTPILTYKQLPDSRRAIVIALKDRGSATIGDLAAILGLTSEAIRQQLLHLTQEGWVATAVHRESRRGRIGRPSTHYRLSPAGEHLFPKNYDALTIAMIDAIREELGEGATVRVLERISNDRVAALAPSVEGRSIEAKIDALKDWYLEDDPYMDTASDGEDYLLIERNCPFYNTAMDRPELCSVTINALTRLLGVRVERQEKFQDGDGRCVFHVFVKEPATNAGFLLEVTRPKPS